MDGDRKYESALDFGIDDGSMGLAEKEAFCMGFELGNIYSVMKTAPAAPIDNWIHTSNVDRIRAACAHLGRECSISHARDEWSYLEVEPADSDAD